MKRLDSQRWLTSGICFLWLCLVATGMSGVPTPVKAQTTDNCTACHSKTGKIVSIFSTSVHAKMAVSCAGCHGGDSSQTEKSRAHSGRFIAKPDSAGTLEMCGKCHRQPVELFKGSRHLATRPNVPRLDCVECHGVHAIGAASETFRWPQFCAGCHGLEYLPQLPRPFQEMLSLADDLREGLHRLDRTQRAQEDLIRRRKEIRHMISELVHKTDTQAGAERIPRILELGTTLKQLITSEEKR